MKRRLKVFFDGGCRPNPGPMEAAVVIRGVSYFFDDLGTGSSTEAEWLALIRAIELARDLGLEDVEFVGLTEEYDRSLELLGRKFPALQGLKATQDGEVKDNFLTRSDITPKLAHELRELNRLDFEIYEAVKGWFLDECKAHGV